MIEGLNTISDLLREYRVIEEQYLRDANKIADPGFVQAVVELYSNIFEYQFRLICHLSRSSAKRAFRSTLELDKWGDMLKKVQTSNDSCEKYCTLSDREREKTFYNNASDHMLRSLDIQKRTLDMFEASQASRQQDRRDDRESRQQDRRDDIKSRQQDRRDDTEADLLESLASDYKSDKDSVSARVPGTCEWFFEDKRFLEWRDNEHSRLLWLSAGPGCGKSVLSRSLIDDRRFCTSAMTSTVCYFFFKDGHEQRKFGANALSAMLHQLFENTALISHALPKAKTYGTKLRDAFGELWEILTKCAQDSEAGQIICVIDALDECEKDSRSQLLEKLRSFFSEEHDSSSYKLKFLVTSRPYDDLEDGFRPLSDVSTYLHFDGDDKSQRIGQDIDLVIDHEMPRIAKGFSAEHCNSITKRLKKMNNRTYLWLFLTIDIITRSPSAYGKESDIGSLLSDLPSEVSSAYEKILSRSSDPERARILLQLIMAATRPLSLQEVNIALTLATQKENCTSYKQLDLWPPENFKSTIQNICGLFVSVHDGKVSLIHQTAREFLLIRNTELPSNKWQGYLDMTTAHCTMFQICLDYLNLHDFAIPVDQLDPDNPLQQRDELFKYAALNWAIHYVSQDSERVKDSCGAAKLCDISLPQRSDWFDTYCDEAYRNPAQWNSLGIASLLGLRDVAETFLNKGADIGAQGEGFANALCAASEGGHEKVVQMLLDKGADININTQGELYDNALCAALQEGYEKIVQMLLDKGPDFDAQNGYYGNALYVASRGGYEKVVQILLKKEVDINIQGEYYGDALYAASQEGHEKVVEMLLDKEADGFGKALCAASRGGYEKVVQMFLNKEADVSAQGESFANALCAASKGGHEKVVQLLLGKGADINAQVEFYGNALEAASSGGYDQIVQMLLEKGADVNAQGGEALQAASKGGHEKVVTMLLDNGADVNAQGGYYGYGNALYAASEGGHKKVVQTLLNRGVDVKAQGEEALQAASSGGYDKVVQMLLDRGVGVNAQGGEYGNALQAASYGGHGKVVTMLLDNGADVNAQGGDYGNALQAASSGGYDKVVQILLDKGADVKAQGGKYVRW